MMSFVRSLPGVIGILLTGLGPVALAQMQAAAPVADCSTLPAYMAKIAADWTRPARNIKAMTAPEGDLPVPIGEKVVLTLLPWEDVKLAVQPSEQGKVVNFAGMYSLRPTKSGVHRFLTTPYVWLEIIAADAPAPKLRMAFSDKRLYCAGIEKDVAFELEAGTRYWFQVSGIKRPQDVEVMVYPPE